MIEIQAALVREQTAVFICGEAVECFIKFLNPPLPEHKIAQSNSDILENLAWATVQIHCLCQTTPDRKKSVSEVSETGQQSATSLGVTSGGQGNVILSTEPKFLFCDLRLAPGESKSYLFKEDLPKSGPPSYRGVGIKYFYKITIATQRVGSKVQLLNVPLRVLPKPDFDNPEASAALCDETNDDVTPTNPFLEKTKDESYIELILHFLQNLTARRCPNFYIITNKRGRVGRFCLFKSNYKLGEDIVGTLDFTNHSVRCVQYSVTLQCEEQLLDEKDRKTTVTNFTKHHEVCLGLLETQVILPVPLHVTPTFSTESVDVRWRLHFQFVTTTSEDLSPECERGGSWEAPVDIDIETMIWYLPVKIFPTNPLQISQPSGTHTLHIK